MGSKIEREYEEITRTGKWMFLFFKMGQSSSLFLNYSAIEARKPENKHLNRYNDVNPYDHSRVKLRRIEKDYINASFVSVPDSNRKYILTQGPLPETAGHFWLMVWEQNSTGIIMLNKLIEKAEIKCHQYWPDEYSPQTKFENEKLLVTWISQKNNTNYIIRKFKLHDIETNEIRVVLQYHYITWPDFSVPESAIEFLDFLEVVRLSGVLDSNVRPAIVHCSAGIGRSGTFCFVDSTLVIMERDGVDSVDMNRLLHDIRSQRMGLIQTPDQLRFSYQAIIQGIRRYVCKNNEQNAVQNILPLPIDDEIIVIEDRTPSPPPLPPRDESLSRSMCYVPLPAVPTDSSIEYIEDESDSSISESNEDVNTAEIDDLDEMIQDIPDPETSQNFQTKENNSTNENPKKNESESSIVILPIVISIGVIAIGILCLYLYRF